jgi:hypothetical protein
MKADRGNFTKEMV